MVDACVGGKTAGAGDGTQTAEVASLVAGQDRGAGEAVTDHAVGEGELGDFGEVVGDPGELRRVGQAEKLDGPWSDGTAEQPVAGGGVVDPQQLLADPLRVGVGEGEAEIG